MSYLGPRQTVDLLYAVGGIDASAVLNFAMRNGLTPQAVISRAAAAVGRANEAIYNRFSGMFYLTTADHARYRAGVGAGMTQRKVEFKRGNGVRGNLSGHMLMLDDYEDALEWTALYLRDAMSDMLDADIQEVIDRWVNRATTEILWRMFSPDEIAIGGGWSVPWAIGSDAEITPVNVPYRPAQWEGHLFDDDHQHFVWKNSSTNGVDHADLFDAMILELRHHGYTGRLVALVSFDDVAEISGIDGFVHVSPPGFQVVGGDSTIRLATGEVEGVPGELFGYYNSIYGVVELRYHERIPAGYAFMTRSFGSNNLNNGIAIRRHPDLPFGLRADPQVTHSINPELDYILFKGTFGVGINRRLNGVAGYIADGATEYEDPEIGTVNSVIAEE